MTRTPLTPRQLGMLLAVLAAFGFSFKAIFVKLAYLSAPVDAITLLSLRMLFSLPLFLLSGYAYLRNGPALTLKDWALLVFLGLTGYYGASILDFAGLQYISAGLERVILFTYPTITILIGLLFLDKKASPQLIAALVLCYAGVSLVFVSDHQLAGDSAAPWLGAALVFASAVSYACYTAFAEVSIGKLGAARFSILALIVSILAAQLHFLVTNPISDLIQPLPIYADGAVFDCAADLLPVRRHPAHWRRTDRTGGDAWPGDDHLLQLVAAGRAADLGTAGGHRAGHRRNLSDSPAIMMRGTGNIPVPQAQSVTSIRREAIGAEQQRDVVMGYGGIDLENHRYFREEGFGLLLGKPVAGLEGHPVGAVSQMLALRVQPGDTPLLIGDALAERLPLGTLQTLQRYHHIRRRQTVLQIQHMNAKRVIGGGSQRAHGGQKCGPDSVDHGVHKVSPDRCQAR